MLWPEEGNRTQKKLTGRKELESGAKWGLWVANSTGGQERTAGDQFSRLAHSAGESSSQAFQVPATFRSYTVYSKVVFWKLLLLWWNLGGWLWLQSSWQPQWNHLVSRPLSPFLVRRATHPEKEENPVLVVQVKSSQAVAALGHLGRDNPVSCHPFSTPEND